MIVEYREITASKLLNDHSELVKQHWLEIKHTDSHDVDVERYKQLDDQGVLRVIGVYKDDECVGYSSFMLSPHAHDVNHMCAFIDSIYVQPKNRTYVGGRLIERTELYAKESGAKSVMWACKSNTALMRLLMKRKYLVFELVLKKEV